MAGPNITLESPTRKLRAGGIKSVVGEFTATGRLGAATALQWISDGCEFPKPAPGLCYAPVPVAGPKTFDGLDTLNGIIFALYAGVRCYLGPGADYDTRATALLTQGEDRGVEEALWDHLQATATHGSSETGWVNAVAVADEYADVNYVGQPVLMMSRGSAVAARAENAIFGYEGDGKLWTANGTPVIASGAAASGGFVLLGWPTVYTSAAVVNNVIDHAVNQEMAIAERIYGLAVDCEFARTYTVEEGG